MIKVKVSLEKIVISGHANYAPLGQDILCASVSSIVTTTINGILSLEDTISYLKKDGHIEINIKEKTKTNVTLLNNMINLLEDLSKDYKKNIKIIKEDIWNF